MLTVVAPGVDDGFHDLGQEVQVRAGGVFRGKFHVLDELPGAGHAFRRHAQDFRFRLLQLELHVQLAGGQEDVDARAVACRFRALAAASMSALTQRASPAMRHFLISVAMVCTASKVSVGDAGKPRFNDIHSESFHLTGHFQFFTEVHGSSGALFSIAKGGVKKIYLVGHDMYQLRANMIVCLFRESKPYAGNLRAPSFQADDRACLCQPAVACYSDEVKIRFYLNDQAERTMALWSESRQAYLVADSVLKEVEACHLRGYRFHRGGNEADSGVFGQSGRQGRPTGTG